MAFLLYDYWYFMFPIVNNHRIIVWYDKFMTIYQIIWSDPISIWSDIIIWKWSIFMNILSDIIINSYSHPPNLDGNCYISLKLLGIYTFPSIWGSISNHFSPTNHEIPLLIRQHSNGAIRMWMSPGLRDEETRATGPRKRFRWRNMKQQRNATHVDISSIWGFP